MLKIQFRSGCKWTHEEIVVEEPYALVGEFIASDVQSSVHSAERTMKLLRSVIDGSRPPLDNATGNAWTMDIDANVARLTCYFATPHETVELPTAWLLDAVERWRDHMIACRTGP